MTNISTPNPETYFRYLPVSSRDQAWGLYVTTAGYVKIEPEMSYPPPGHPDGYAFSWQSGRVLDEYQLHYLPRGSGVFESRPSGCRRVEAGDFFLLFPGMRHRYAPLREAGWDEYWIGFKGDQADQLVKRGFFSPKRPVFKSLVGHGALDLFSEILTQLHAQSIGFMQVIAAHTMQLLAEILASDQARRTDTRTHRIVRAVRHSLHSCRDGEIDIEKLAEELSVSYSWLRRAFRQYTGLPPHQYHLQLRLNRAMQLLAATGCTVRDAASQIGYRDQYYFSRLFKLKTGRSPEAWKRLAMGSTTRAGRATDDSAFYGT